MSWTFTHTYKLPAAPDRVFRAWTDPGELTRWFAERVEVNLKPGGPYRFWGKYTLGWPTANEAQQSVLEVEPGRKLAFSWTLYQTGTEVSIDLAPTPEGTDLTLNHKVSGDFGIRRSHELIEDHWGLSCGNLLKYLEGGAEVYLPDYSDPRPEIRHVITIDAPPTTVWRALIEPQAIQQWLMSKHVVVDPRIGGEYNLNWKYQVQGRDVVAGTGKILEFEPHHKLVITWLDWRGDTSVDGQTISFTLEPVEKQTRLTFVHTGFERTADFGDYPFGWGGFVELLGKVAEGMK